MIRSLVVVLPGGPSTEPWSIGSGTLVRCGERVAVLTAAHVAVDSRDHEVRLLVPGTNPRVLHDAAAALVMHRDEHLDVGVIFLRPQYEMDLRAQAEAIETFAAAPPAISERDAIEVVGWPHAMRREISERHSHYEPIMFDTDLAADVDSTVGGLPGLRIHWSIALSELPAILEPHGVSGGPVWWFPNAKGDELWTPDFGRILAFVSAFERVTAQLRAPAAWDWLAWLRDVLEQRAASGL